MSSLTCPKCTSAFQNSMLSVCAQVIRYRAEGIDFTLVPPESRTLQNLFRNTNWGYFLDPGQYRAVALPRPHSDPCDPVSDT